MGFVVTVSLIPASHAALALTAALMFFILLIIYSHVYSYPGDSHFSACDTGKNLGRPIYKNEAPSFISAYLKQWSVHLQLNIIFSLVTFTNISLFSILL